MITLFKQERPKPTYKQKREAARNKRKDFYDSFNGFYETDYDWAGSFKYNGKQYCGLHIGISYPSNDMIRLSFWGNDDLGMEKEYNTYEAAINDLKLIDALRTVNPEDLQLIGFDFF